MASVVILGLAPAMALTLVVVPDLYALAYTTSLGVSHGLKMYPKGLLGSLLRPNGTSFDKDDQH